MFFSNKIIRYFFTVFIFLSFSNPSAASSDLTCTVTVLSNWGSGSALSFGVKNNTNRDIPIWNLKVSYPQNYFLTTSWSVNAVGTNPIVFSNVAGNVLKPGQAFAQHFGYQVNHGGLPFQVPKIDWCGEPQVGGQDTVKTIDSVGGIIENASIGSVVFDASAFSAST